MKVFRGVESPRSADTNSFVGTAHTKPLASDEAATPVHVYRVEFELASDELAYAPAPVAARH
jgi:hypothetical protein